MEIYLIKQGVNSLFIIQRKSKNGTTNYDCKQFVPLGIETALLMRFEIRVLLNSKLDRSVYPLVLRYRVKGLSQHVNKNNWKLILSSLMLI